GPGTAGERAQDTAVSSREQVRAPARVIGHPQALPGEVVELNVVDERADVASPEHAPTAPVDLRDRAGAPVGDVDVCGIRLLRDVVRCTADAQAAKRAALLRPMDPDQRERRIARSV